MRIRSIILIALALLPASVSRCGDLPLRLEISVLRQHGIPVNKLPSVDPSTGESIVRFEPVYDITPIIKNIGKKDITLATDGLKVFAEHGEIRYACRRLRHDDGYVRVSAYRLGVLVLKPGEMASLPMVIVPSWDLRQKGRVRIEYGVDYSDRSIPQLWNGVINAEFDVESGDIIGETIKEANQPPLRMPVSGTPAADAPVAPPPGIAGR